ncbi:MAG: hypothetical protein JNK04_12945 [Myxococcales bacterium]|nr:hypothetical protein [Myxococcales bacterium]
MRMTLVALAFTACYAVAQLAGLRDSVSVLATGAANDALPGLFYAASYFAAVLLAPPLLLAAGMIATGRALSKRATDEST